MRIDPATTDDLDAVLDAWTALAAEQRRHGSHVDPAESREGVRERLAHDAVAGDLLIAREDDDLLGFVAIGVEDPPLERGVRRGIVRYLYVVPDRRDEGIGTALLDAAEQRLADRGCAAVAVEALADNEAARRLYRRRGYDPHRVELEKSLDAGEAADGNASADADDDRDGDGDGT